MANSFDIIRNIVILTTIILASVGSIAFFQASRIHHLGFVIMPQRFGIFRFVAYITISARIFHITHFQTSGRGYLSLHIMASWLLNNSAAVSTNLRFCTGSLFAWRMANGLLIFQSYSLTICAAIFKHTLAAAGCVHHIFTFAPAVSGSLSIIYGIAISAICASVGCIALLLASRSSYLLIVAMTKSIAVFRFVA